MNKKLFICVEGICVRSGKVLLVKRAVEPFKGCWHLVGGHVDEHETLKEALKREFKEETNLDVKIGKIIEWRIEKTHDRIKLVVSFKIMRSRGEINLNWENVDYGWFSKFPPTCVYDYSKYLNC